MTNILVLHGPNLNLLGTREPEHYGSIRLDDINQRLQQQASAAGHEIECFQSNAEHELVNKVQSAPENKIGIIIINQRPLPIPALPCATPFRP